MKTNCNTSTLVAGNTSNQALVVNDIAVLNTSEKTGCHIQFDGGTSPIRLKSYGVYLVSVSATVLGTVAGEVTLQLLVNGSPLSGASASATAVAGDTMNLAFTTIVPALYCPCSSGGTQSIQVQLLGNDATITDINVAVVKVG